MRTALNIRSYVRIAHSRDPNRLKSIDVLGGSYVVNDDLSLALYHSDIEDLYKRYYANLNYDLALAAEQALNFDFNLYRTKYDEGSAAALDFGGDGQGDRNTIWSLAAKYSIGAHAFILAHQRNIGLQSQGRALLAGQLRAGFQRLWRSGAALQVRLRARRQYRHRRRQQGHRARAVQPGQLHRVERCGQGSIPAPAQLHLPLQHRCRPGSQRDSRLRRVSAEHSLSGALPRPSLAGVGNAKIRGAA
jgi:hypothetical protein